MIHGPGESSVPFYVARAEAAFPLRLHDVRPASRGLWVDGRLPRAASDEPLIAMVGARAASKVGCATVARLSAALVEAGFGIVSGGALGVDAAAHEGALSAGGATFAVLGCGIDVVYPDRHRRLFRQIARAGGLLSEHAAGVQPKMWHFPVRNRLVAGLAEAIVVAECRPGSGAWITVDMAVRLRRKVLAVPGSAGTDALLRAGRALPVDSAAAVRAVLAGAPLPTPAAGPAADDPDEAAFAPLRAALGAGPVSPEALALKLGMPVAEVLGVLLQAELDGRVHRLVGGRFEVSRGN